MRNKLQELKIINKKGRLNSHKWNLKDTNPDLFDEIVRSTSFLDIDAPLSHRIYCIENNIISPQHCVTCGSTVELKSLRTGFPRFCSPKCQFTNDQIRDQIKRTCNKKYQCDNPMQSEVIKQKVCSTNQERLGSDYPLQNKEILHRTHQTMIERHGDVGFKSKKIQERAKNRIKETYGKPCVANNHEISVSVREKLVNVDWIKQEHHNSNKSFNAIGHQLGVSGQTVAKYAHLLGIETKRFAKSTYEVQLEEWFRELEVDFTTNDRSLIKPKELDFIFPKHKIALEFNGSFTHGERYSKKNKRYHLLKTEQCKELGYKLIHLMEHEWVSMTSIVQSRLRSMFNMSPNRIYARQCSLIEIDRNTKRNFLHNNHIQGDCPSKVNLALTYNDEVVCVMTFGTARFNSQFDFELLRFCNKLNTNVVGGAGKLFKHFRRTHNGSIISYSDVRWNTGNLYEMLGFTYSHNSAPNYHYFHPRNSSEVFSRNQFQKHKLASKLDKFDPTLSEWDNMKLNGFDRYWDCGNMVFTCPVL